MDRQPILRIRRFARVGCRQDGAAAVLFPAEEQTRYRRQKEEYEQQRPGRTMHLTRDSEYRRPTHTLRVFHNRLRAEKYSILQEPPFVTDGSYRSR